MPRDGTANLKPQTTRTKEEQKEVAKLGGKQSGVVRKQQKVFREALFAFMDKKIKPYATENEIAKRIQEDNPNVTMAQAMALAQIYKAMTGDTAAYTAVRDTIGEKPVEKSENTTKMDMSDKLQALVERVAKRINE